MVFVCVSVTNLKGYNILYVASRGFYSSLNTILVPYLVPCLEPLHKHFIYIYIYFIPHHMYTWAVSTLKLDRFWKIIIQIIVVHWKYLKIIYVLLDNLIRRILKDGVSEAKDLFNTYHCVYTVYTAISVSYDLYSFLNFSHEPIYIKKLSATMF